MYTRKISRICFLCKTPKNLSVLGTSLCIIFGVLSKIAFVDLQWQFAIDATLIILMSFSKWKIN